eukprot:6292548-Prymnesium_polylepis.1
MGPLAEHRCRPRPTCGPMQSMRLREAGPGHRQIALARWRGPPPAARRLAHRSTRRAGCGEPPAARVRSGPSRPLRCPSPGCGSPARRYARAQGRLPP